MRRWKGNIEMGFKEIGYDGVTWMQLQVAVVVNTAMKDVFSEMYEISCSTEGLSFYLPLYYNFTRIQ
jgi:hypothetical protein